MSANRHVVLASADAALRERLRASLAGMRWQVSEAGGGAEAMAQMEEHKPEALLMDNWLPDLEANEFAGQISAMYPGVDVLRLDGDPVAGSVKSARRHELLHALREATEPAARSDTAAWAAAPVSVPMALPSPPPRLPRQTALFAERPPASENSQSRPVLLTSSSPKILAAQPAGIEGMVGATAPMLELARLIRLVAPQRATVLIEGETGTGKEVVANAVHRLSGRAKKPFTVLNCAAIPETLLEAELFGHARGAFTGAVQSRTGRIEAANGGTLFLDEIGEMPLALQAKMLRFLECGELQRVGDNDMVHVDVRVIAATHQDLEKRTADGTFRLDLYHRLAVFPIEVPPLRERMDDLDALAEHFLAEMGRNAPRKQLSAAALALLAGYNWPGNVRELAHVLERAAILAGDSPEIGPGEMRLRRQPRQIA
jgi:DNA-binding NtrC family response regulator